jgi:hypothetical protein
MFASVRHYKGVSDPTELGQRVQDDFVPILKTHQGFVAYYWVDSGDNEMVSMSVFEKEEDAIKSNEEAKGWVKENVAELLPNPPEINEGEVVATG